MKNSTCRILAVLVFVSSFVHAASNINNPNDDSYGANIGWMSWRADAGTNGVVTGEYWLSGFIYGANVGWIKVGATNIPPNNVAWQNSAATNFGVNVLNTGELRGLAYGANIGWITFTNMTATGPLASTDLPRIDFTTGKFRGFAYGANVGWISLSNAFGFVQADSISNAPDTDGDGIADAYELTYAGNLTTLSGAGHDQDGDGKSDVDEYNADTNPFDNSDNLRIIAVGVTSPGNTSTLTWTSKPSRLYQIQSNSNLVTGAWANTGGLVPADFGPTTTRTDTQTATSNRFYRIQSKKPLTP
jgi:hypothetical protein